MKRLTLHGSASDIQRARQRLLREGGILRRLHHPNIVRLLDIVEDGDEIVLVMPYLNGGNLAERVAQHGPAPPEEVHRLAQRLLGALATAHAAGIVHRDIKPANVLFDDKGEPLLADFGVAHTWDQTSGLTVTGMVVGTPGFMAPEQARDEQLTPSSDVFSLGATLLFAATGLGPYGPGDPGLLMVKAAGNKVERIPKSLPAGLRRRLRIMLDPRPDRRPTAGALLTGDQSALRRPPAPLTGTAPAMAFTAFAAAVVVVALAVSGTSGDDEPDNADPPAAEDTTTAPDVSDSPEGSAGDALPSEQAPLEESIDGSLPPGGTAIYPLVVDGLDGCPAEVTVDLETDSVYEANLVALRITREIPAGEVLDEAKASFVEPGRISFPVQGCGSSDVEFQVIVSAPAEAQEPIDYRITRVDS